MVLKEDVQLLNDVAVVASKINSTEYSARSTEKASFLTMNIMSSQAIELSTDLDVGGVVQRISGVSLERSGSGSGNYVLNGKNPMSFS